MIREYVVKIPLTFDAKEEAYIGSDQIYAYGTLGNAYEGLKIVAIKGLRIMVRQVWTIEKFMKSLPAWVK